VPLNYIKKAAGVFVTAFATMSAMPASAQNQIVMIDDFSNGVNFSATLLQNNMWTPARYNYRTVTAADNYNGNPVMKITDPDGGENGVYAIYPNAVPADGDYTLRCTMKIHEQPSFTGNPPKYEGIRSYCIGLTLNGAHRSGTSVAPNPAIYSDPINTILTSGNDSTLPPITLRTSKFAAQAGDDLRISFSTYHQFGSGFSTVWNGSYLLINDIELVPDPEPTIPVSLSGWELE
jgi:hypothetical protein